MQNSLKQKVKLEATQLGRQDGVKEANLQRAKQLLSDGVARENIKRYFLHLQVN
ncbi:hypothetical protein [Candidatus Williamhamiltonella defendens]|uniref:hypothetical protein n=1 Tax=Candidatus Williamhamiltonella defendens TaxID=138072 RepID=UPI0013E0E076|nr:hypothetical protein [Candidatus Hamiltonella defensa]